MVNPAEVQALAAPMSMAERWSLPSSVEGGYLLIDPLTGERLDTQQPPVWIRDDQALAGGLAYLRRNASNLDVTILYGRHGVAEDLGDPQTGWYERQVKAADFYGYEGLHTQEAIQQAKRNGTIIVQNALARSQPPRLEHFLQVGSRIGASSFEMRTIAAMTLIDTPSFPIDVAADGTAVEQALIQASVPLLQHPDSDIAGVAHLGFENTREWIAAAHLGVEVHRRFGELRSLLRGFVTFGTEHRDLQRKLEISRLTVHAKRLKAYVYNPQEEFDMSGMLESGIVLPTETREAAGVARAVSNYLKNQN
jgi:hypothetical protein